MPFPTANQAVADNPLYEEFRRHYVPSPSPHEWEVPEYKALVPNVYRGPEWDAYCEAGTRGHRARGTATRRWAWAIPSEAALSAIGSLGPIVEVGCGTGYWANMLLQRGVDIVAFDTRKHLERSGWLAQNVGYAPMAVGGPERAMRMYPQRTLMLCWPPYGDDGDMAARCLELTQAEHVVFIGEIHGCTGGRDCMALLGEGGSYGDEDLPSPDPLFEQVDVVDIPQWPGMHDACYIYRRLAK